MMRRVAGLLVLLLGATATSAWADVAVTYVANEGVLLEGGGRKVLIDALFDEGIPEYGRIPAELRPALEEAEPPFDGADAILVTHVHRDHFGARAVARHLRANRKIRLLSTRQVVDELRAFVGDAAPLLERVEVVDPVEGESEVREFRGVRITVLNLHHGRDRNPPIQNLGFLVEIGGLRVLHVGDSEATLPDLRPYRLTESRIDLALLPTWYLADEAWRRAVPEGIRPARIALIHEATIDAPPAYFAPERTRAGLRKRLVASFPNLVLFERAGETREFRK